VLKRKIGFQKPPLHKYAKRCKKPFDHITVKRRTNKQRLAYEIIKKNAITS
jgi:hypothetical protein